MLKASFADSFSGAYSLDVLEHIDYLGDDLFACQPFRDAVLSSGADFLFTAKPESHKTLYDFMNGAARDELSVTRKEGGKKLNYRYRWFSGAPPRDGKPALDVNWIGVIISDTKGKATYDGAFVTSLEVSRENVVEIAACARARWKIENESFNILKNNGYHLEHNFGHGKRNLAMLFAAMNLLAFAMHTVCDCLEHPWAEAREAKRARKRFFEHIRTLTAYLVFPGWRTLMTTLINSKPPKSKNRSLADARTGGFRIAAAMLGQLTDTAPRLHYADEPTRALGKISVPRRPLSGKKAHISNV